MNGTSVAQGQPFVAAAAANVPERKSGALIDVRDVTKVYGEGESAVRALDGVTLSIDRGEFVAIMGPSGSGKSTFMHLLGCLDRPTSGSYRLDGREVAGLTRDQLALVRSRQIGFVFQSFNLLSRTSALENVELPMLYIGEPRNERERRSADLLRQVGLGPRLHHKPNEPPVASSNGWRSPGRLQTGPRSSWPTSRRETWTARAASTY